MVLPTRILVMLLATHHDDDDDDNNDDNTSSNHDDNLKSWALTTRCAFSITDVKWAKT